MFEQSLVESAAVLRSRNRWPAVISVTFYTAIALTLASLPMLHPEVLSFTVHPLLTFTPPRPYTPPPPPTHIQPTLASGPSSPAPLAPILNKPSITPSTAPAEVPNFDSHATMTTSTPTTLLGSSTATGPAIRVASGTGTGGSGNTTHERLKVSNGVSAGLLLAPIRPIYPPIALTVHMQGTVIVQAIISRTGQIESAHVVSGPAMLQGSALEAVRSARYRPYLLNGQPTEVDTTFNINFRLGGAD